MPDGVVPQCLVKSSRNASGCSDRDGVRCSGSDIVLSGVRDAY